jgi:hypothetical protein
VFVYKAPACKLEHFKEVFLSDVLRNLNIQQSNILIIGDFNFSEQNMNENHPKYTYYKLTAVYIILWSDQYVSNASVFTFCVKSISGFRKAKSNLVAILV